MVATLPAYEPAPGEDTPAETAAEHDAPAAAGDDVCAGCDDWQPVRWHGEVGVREPFNVWSCTRCGAQWSTRVRRATADLELSGGAR